MCCCSIFVFTLRMCLGNFISSLNWCSLVSDAYVSSSFLLIFPVYSLNVSFRTCHSLINSHPCLSCNVPLLSLSLLSPAMQNCLSGAPQGNPSTLCHEEDQPAEPDASKPNPAGVCGARHPHLCWKPVCGFYVLLLWDTEAPLHGHGVCGRWGLNYPCVVHLYARNMAHKTNMIFFYVSFFCLVHRL